MPTLNDLIATEADQKRAEAEIARLRAEVERLRAALSPFAELYGPYRYDGTPDGDVVRSAGTLGKDGDRGYSHVTVADLRRAAAALSASEQE